MSVLKEYSYGTAIRSAFAYLLNTYPEVVLMGQGLWSPWYVGNTMTDLDKEFGVSRVIDTPVSELGVTGAAVGAALSGLKPIVVHPRMDFMLYAMDPIVNEAAKWSHMTGGQVGCNVTIRAIINRGGEQGAQHSQALHAWFAHIPGLRVVMPSSVADARDLLIASVLSPDPVVYIDDRWLYERTDSLPNISEINLAEQGPKVIHEGCDVTIVGIGYSTYLCEQAMVDLVGHGISPELIDLRVINPIDAKLIIKSVNKTGRLCVVDGGWKACGVAGEIIARVVEGIGVTTLKTPPIRIVLPDAPAPCSKSLESLYYPDKKEIVKKILACLFNKEGVIK